MKYIWIATTNDKYEFPVYFTDNSKKLANKINSTQSVVCHASKRGHNANGYKIFKVADIEE